MVGLVDVDPTARAISEDRRRQLKAIHPTGSDIAQYTVRSTKETSRLEARKVAEELAYETAQGSPGGARIGSSTTRKGMLRKPSARRRAGSAMPTTFGRQPSH